MDDSHLSLNNSLPSSAIEDALFHMTQNLSLEDPFSRQRLNSLESTSGSTSSHGSQYSQGSDVEWHPENGTAESIQDIFSGPIGVFEAKGTGWYKNKSKKRIRNRRANLRLEIKPRNIPIPEIICGFCKKNGETRAQYSSHVVKDDRGIVVCPVLRKYKCPMCLNEDGDKAHTKGHCPLNDSGKSWGRVLGYTRNSMGRITYQYV